MYKIIIHIRLHIHGCLLNQYAEQFFETFQEINIICCTESSYDSNAIYILTHTHTQDGRLTSNPF